VVETVTEDVLVEPARMSASGTVQAPPVYRSETRQRIVAPRKVDWTEVVCPTALRTEFVASVQRALAVRDHYAGPVTGQMSAATREAIRSYQQQTGLAGPVPGVLTIRAAQSLGLWAVPIEGE
jgi:peptidoglycan hydrolase-like protein with peptidoglycan-binding domain